MTNNEQNQLALMVLKIAQNQRYNEANTIYQPTNKAVRNDIKGVPEGRQSLNIEDKFPTKEPANYLMDAKGEAGIQETSYTATPATEKSFKLL